MWFSKSKCQFYYTITKCVDCSIRVYRSSSVRVATWNKHLRGVNLPYYASILLFAFAFLLSNNFVGKIDASLILGLS